MASYKESKIGNGQVFLTNGGNVISVSNISISIDGVDADAEDFDRKLLDHIHINTYSGYSQLIDSALTIESPMIHISVDPECAGYVVVKANVNGSANTIYSASLSAADITESSFVHPRRMFGSDTSFELLRTNPKLTGNVKVVVDSDSNMYLDTFKTLPALSARKYRKIAINPDEYYGRAVMEAFHDMTSDDFYGIPSSCYAAFSAANDYKDQYFDKYNCGVRTNDDEFYSENYSILAPLRIREIRPDFFLVFKVDDDVASISSDSEMLKYFFTNGKLVKSFDMRGGSNLGKYIDSIYDHAKDCIGDAYFAYDDENFNTNIGISIDRGVVTSAYETAKKIYMNCRSQVALNNWITEGFERNRLVCKDMVNFEFMFDDIEENLFSINRYFGVYVRLNSEGEFVCTGAEDGKYTFADGAPSDFNPSDVSLAIYGFADEDKFVRISTPITDAEDGKLDEYIVNGITPDINVAHPNAFDVIDASGYVTVTFDAPMKVGEHYRIIDRQALKVYEILISNAGQDGEISDLTFNTYNVGDSSIGIQRISISKNSEGTAENDAKMMFTAMKMFSNAVFKPLCISGSSISFSASASDVYFEKVCSIPGFTNSQLGILKTYNETSMKVFGSVLPPRSYLSCEGLVSAKAEDAVFYPINAMVTGDRIGYIVKFMSLDGCVEIDNSISDDIFDDVIVYQNTDDDYVQFEKAEIIFMIDASDGFDEETASTPALLGSDLTRLIVHTPSVKLRSDRLLLYNTHKIYPGICSIFPLKDIYTDVIDTKEENSLIYGSSETISDDRGEYASDENCYSTAILGVDEENFKDYVDIAQNFEHEYESDGEAAIWGSKEVELEIFTRNVREAMGKNATASTPVTAQSVCKWKFTGTDARGMAMRLMFKECSINDSSADEGYLKSGIRSYFVIPDSSEPDSSMWKYGSVDEAMMEGIGFISGAESAETDPKYIDRNLDDVVPGGTQTTLREYILNGSGSIDDYIYSENNHSDKYSIAYTQGENSVVFISGGMKVCLTSTNKAILNLTKYNGYRAVFVSAGKSLSDHNTPYEVIIDETEGKILVVWYTKSSKLSGATADLEVQLIGGSHPMSDCIASGSTLYTPMGSSSITSVTCIDIESVPRISGSYSNEDSISIISMNGTMDASSMMLKSDASTGDESFAQSYINGTVEDIVKSSTISESATSYYQKTDMYAIVDGSADNVPGIDDAFNGDSAIYVKTLYGTNDYTTISGLFSISRIEPYQFTGRTPIESEYRTHGFVLPSYIEPVTKDMISFKFGNASIDSSIGFNLSGCNICVESVNTLAQLWIRKMIDPTSVARTGYITDSYIYVDALKNISLMKDVWNNSVYRKYDYYTDEVSYVSGVSVGYEQNMFLASRAINFNGIEGNVIEITSWKNVEAGDGYIKLDITGSLIELIMLSPGFVKSWLGMNSSSMSSYKTKYIENSILTRIDITNSTTFGFYSTGTETGIMEMNDYDSAFEEYKISNIENELVMENGRYYMYIYPKKPNAYAAKMTIQL